MGEPLRAITTEVQNSSDTAPVSDQSSHVTVHRQIRGSGLLLAGRVISALITFISQVLIVRHLSLSDYGAFAYALALTAASQSFSSLGLHKSLSRFVPIYQEKGDHDRIVGAVVLSAGVILATVVLIAIAIFTVPRPWIEKVLQGHQGITVLCVLIFLVPIEALNDILISLFACFGRPRDIFFRTHILGPMLRLFAVLALIAVHAGVVFLAIGYLLSSLVGTLLYVGILTRFIAKLGLFKGVRLNTIRVPARDMFSFAVPILTSEIVTATMMTSLAVMFLGYFHGMNEVAIYRAAVPAARLNMIVMASFSLLFTPAAARLFAKADFEGVSHLYWRTTAWMTLASFPLFVATFSLSKPLTLFLYGERYRDSANILALLALAFYINVALGLNTLTLRVIGRLRPIIVVNVTAAVANVLLSLVLIPRYGATGAAIATTAGMVLLNVMTQLALCSDSRFKSFDSQCGSVYFFVLTGALGLYAVQSVTAANIYAAAALGIVTCISVFGLCKKNLDVAGSFPELTKIPIVRALFT